MRRVDHMGTATSPETITAASRTKKRASTAAATATTGASMLALCRAGRGASADARHQQRAAHHHAGADERRQGGARMNPNGGAPYIQRVVSLIHEHGAVTELRSLKTNKGTISGYFDDFAKLAKIADELNGNASVYVMLNPVNPALLARANNRIEPYARETTADKYIVKRRWLPLDFDPVRPSGISATDEEKEAALERARKCRDWLTSLGFPSGLFADSGNGGHLLYLIDLPNDAPSTELIKRCIEAVAARFSDDLVTVDLGNFNAARIWKLYGTLACKGDNMPDRPHRMAKIIDGQNVGVVPVELLHKLASFAPEPQPRPRPNGHDQPFNVDDFISRHGIKVKFVKDVAYGRLLILKTCPFNGDHDHGEAHITELSNGAVGFACKHNSCSFKKWQDLRELYEPKGSRKSGDRRKASKGAAASEQSESKHLPELDAGDRDLQRVSRATLEILVSVNQPAFIFRHADMLSRIQQSDDGSMIIRPLSENGLRHILAQYIHWFALKGKQEKYAVPELPPLHVVRDILAMPDPPFPVITRVVHAPIFASDGTLRTNPGYDPTSQIYYDPRGNLEIDVPEAPPAEDVTLARDAVEDVLCDFPFTSETERTHAVGLLLLPFARELIDGPTPLHSIEKPSPGTGAGLLTEVLTTIFLGRGAATMTEGRDEDEWRKRITAKLVRYNDMVVIDNVRRRLESAALSAVLTSTYWEDRILGKTDNATVPNKMTWIMTGNNPAFSNEITRRIVRIRLDSKVDQPWLRGGFKHPELREYVAQNRSKLVSAALTLIQDWIVKGRPKPTSKRLGSFEKWSDVIGGILANAGYTGFLENLDEVYTASDAEGAAWRTLIDAWWEEHQDNEVGVKEIYAIVAPEHGDTIDLELGNGNERSQKTRLGKMLNSVRDRQFNGKRIIKGGISHQAQMWKLED
jgi:hypothetical protein